MSERRPRKTVPMVSKPPSAQQWVSQGKERAPRAERLKRLTLDIPEDLHKALKRLALEEDTTMLELVQTLIEERVQQAQQRGTP
jgi:predicted HicB family RNase H-like nuclease